MSVRPHISFSELMLWNECQWRWFRDYREGRRSEIYSKYLVFGNAVHDALETLKDPSTEETVRLSVDEICDTFEKKFREKYLNIRDKEQKDPLDDDGIDEFVCAGRRIIKNIHKLTELEDAKVLFVEHKLMERINRTDDIDVKFKGFIDVVVRTTDKRGKSVLYIVDYKTCSWGWNSEKRRDEYKQMQLRLYKHFFCKEFNLDPKQVRCAFVLLKRTPKSEDDVAEWLPVSAGPKTTMRAVDRLNEAITGMNSNDYEKNRNACTNAFGDVCPYFETDLCLKD